MIVVHDSGRLYPEAIIFTTTAPQRVLGVGCWLEVAALISGGHGGFLIAIGIGTAADHTGFSDTL